MYIGGGIKSHNIVKVWVCWSKGDHRTTGRMMLHIHYVHNGTEWIRQDEDRLFKDGLEYTSLRFKRLNRIQVGEEDGNRMVRDNEDEDSLSLSEYNLATTVIEVSISNLQPRPQEDKECLLEFKMS